MKFSGYTSKADKYRAWLKKSVVNECPPELYVCEACGELECNNEEWLNCEKRMQARDFMLESGSKSTAETTPYNVLSTIEKMVKL